jgi:hypothetical protein
MAKSTIFGDKLGEIFGKTIRNSSMRASFKLIDSAYTRPNPFGTPAGANLLERAQSCIQAAGNRPARRIEITTNPSFVRTAILGESIPFISVWNKTRCFLGIFPNNFSMPKSCKFTGEMPVSFDAHPFTDSEFAIMDRAMPLLEQRLGDTGFFFRPEDLPSSWDMGMHVLDEIYYRTLYHPMILEEMRYLALKRGDLVCDPACGTGSLLHEIGRQFPLLQRIGADLIEKSAVQAAAVNPGVPICVCDAQDPQYLDVNSVSLTLLSGLVAQFVTTKAQAQTILHQLIARSKDFGYFVITGKTLSHFSSDDMLNMGFWPLMHTKWVRKTFQPFWIYLAPRKIDHGNGHLEIQPIFNDLRAEMGK